MMSIADIRQDYQKQVLEEHSVEPDPYLQFNKWFNEALNSEIAEVNAMTLATSDSSGRPSARIVLLKGLDERGFSFYTNYHSQKAKAMEENNNVALVFFWKELERQVRVEGRVDKLDESESDAYFNSRPDMSKIGAWASPQSSVIESRDVLEKNLEELEKSFAGKPIDRPPHWGGYVVKPGMVEFWQVRPGRLHDRIRYRLAEGKWIRERLAP